jgi:CHAT domain-containing protein
MDRHHLLFFVIFILPNLTFGQNWAKLNKESLAYYNDGQYEAAMPAMQLTLQLAERKYSKSSKQYVTTLTNYAYLQKALGDMPGALVSFQSLCSLSQSVYGKTSIEYVESLNSKANLFLTTASYDSTEVTLNKGLEIILAQVKAQNKYYKKNILKFFNALISNQTSLASLYYHRGQTNSAIDVLEEQIASLERSYPNYVSTSKDYYFLLSNLSTYYLNTGRTGEAKELLVRCLAFEENNAGIASSQYYHLQNNLGSIYRSSDQLDSAQAIWQSAESKLAGSDLVGSEIHLILLTNLGELNLETENYAMASHYLQTSKKLHEQRAGLIPNLYQTTIFNLAEVYRWQGKYPPADSLYQQLIAEITRSIVHEFTYLNEEEKRAFYNNQLTYINTYLSFAFEISNLLPLQESDTPYINPALGGQLYNLQLTTKAIILNSSSKVKRQIIHGNDDELISTYERWESKKNQLATLYSSGSGQPEHLQALVAETAWLERKLSRSSAQFRKGFVINEFTWQDVQSKLEDNEAAVEMIRILDGLAYLAVIITPQTKMPVLSMAISTRSKKLDKEFYNHYKNAIKYKVEDTLSYQVYWQAIRDTIIAHSKGAIMPKKIYFSGDGIYSQINLNTLYNKKTKHYLIDETEIHLLTNTRDLVENSTSSRQSNASKTAVLFGDPEYSLDKNDLSGPFAPLPGTSLEIDQINEHLLANGWETKVYKGSAATVSNLKANGNMRILNLATHGFFNRANADNFYDILLSSGLAFVGANDNFSYLDEDGSLTAYETVNLDLDSTELVVLSACESGKGDYHPGDGVYGLQRAFTVAGATSIIMSLWKVNDTATQELIVDFYRRWIPNKDRRQAFREAQQELRKKYPEPFYWGAFIMLGN